MLSSQFMRCGKAAVLALAVSAVVLPSAMSVAQKAPQSSGVSLPDSAGYVEAGMTKPYEERKIAYSGPGIVSEVKVKVGDKVTATQVMAQQDTSLEEADKAVAQVEASSMIQEDYAKADLSVKKIELKRKQELRKVNGAAASEVEEAELNVARADASVKLAVQERDIAKKKVLGLDAKIALKTMKSPINGYIQMLDTGVGEQGSVDSQQKPAVVVVQTDVLKVDVNIPVATAKSMKVGQAVLVRYIDDDNSPWQPATVLNLKPVADKGSQTRALELEFANTANREAGLRVEVKIPGAVAAVKGGEAQADVQR